MDQVSAFLSNRQQLLLAADQLLEPALPLLFLPSS